MSRLRPEKSTTAATVPEVEANNSVAPFKSGTQAKGNRYGNAETLRKQPEMSNPPDNLKFPCHPGIIKDELPLAIGGGIGQSRYPDAPAAQKRTRRGPRHGLANNPERDGSEEEHLRA